MELTSTKTKLLYGKVIKRKKGISPTFVRVHLRVHPLTQSCRKVTRFEQNNGSDSLINEGMSTTIKSIRILKSFLFSFTNFEIGRSQKKIFLNYQREQRCCFNVELPEVVEFKHLSASSGNNSKHKEHNLRNKVRMITCLDLS